MTIDRAPTVRNLLLAAVIFHVVAPTRAWAYLDPITGSIVLQVLAAGFIAVAATARRTRNWLADIYRKLTAKRGS